jgi:hypothetical protein
MKKTIMFVAIAMLFFTGDVGTGCSNLSSSPAAVPGEATETRVTNALEGKPDQITTQAATVLTSALTPNELKYLENLDWRLLENGGLFKDPVSRKAITALLPIVRGKNLQAWLLQNRVLGIGVAYAQGHICSPAENVAALVVGAFESAVTTAVSFTCIGAAVATGGAGALLCLGAGIVSAAVIIANANCDVNDPDLPPQGDFLDAGLATTCGLYPIDTGTAVATSTSYTTDTGESTSTGIATNTNTATDTATESSSTTLATTDTGTGTDTGQAGIDPMCLEFKNSLIEITQAIIGCLTAEANCYQGESCSAPDFNTTCNDAYVSCMDPVDIIEKGSTENCPNNVAFSKCRNACSFVGSDCDSCNSSPECYSTCFACEDKDKLSGNNCVLKCADLLP